PEDCILFRNIYENSKRGIESEIPTTISSIHIPNIEIREVYLLQDLLEFILIGSREFVIEDEAIRRIILGEIDSNPFLKVRTILIQSLLTIDDDLDVIVIHRYHLDIGMSIEIDEGI